MNASVGDRSRWPPLIVASLIALASGVVGAVIGIAFPRSPHPDDRVVDIVLCAAVFALFALMLAYPLTLCLQRKISPVDAVAGISLPVVTTASGYRELCGDRSSARLLMCGALLVLLYLIGRTFRSAWARRST